jgi:hypothetical protein
MSVDNLVAPMMDDEHYRRTSRAHDLSESTPWSI